MRKFSSYITESITHSLQTHAVYFDDYMKNTAIFLALKQTAHESLQD
jgi:hypothetical protein